MKKDFKMCEAIFLQAGILELLNDPFARTRVVSKKGKINTHRDSYNRGFKV